MAAGRRWTREEIAKAIVLYCETPFGKIDKRNPSIIALADYVGRTPSSVGLKLANLASLDVSIDRAGMRNASDLDREVWAEFFEDPETFLDMTEPSPPYVLPQPSDLYPPGLSEVLAQDVPVAATSRRGQGFFRNAVLASYNSKCCITSISRPELLNASHIVPWASDKKQRLNPANGLCLNALHDRAFDRGLICLDEDLRLVLSREVRGVSAENFEQLEGDRIRSPERFLPSSEALKAHREMAATKFTF